MTNSKLDLDISIFDDDIPAIWNITNIDMLDESLFKESLPHYKHGNKKLDNLITSIYNSKIDSIQIKEIDSIIQASCLDYNDLDRNDLRRLVKIAIRTHNYLYKDKTYSYLDGMYKFSKLSIATDHTKYIITLRTRKNHVCT
jgi:hypothetical protein